MALKISSGGTKRLTDEERQALGGSVYDQQYFTDDQLRQAAQAREAARAGTTDWASAHNLVEGFRKSYGYTGGAKGNEYNQLPGYIAPQKIDMPEYVSRFDPYITQGVDTLLSRPAFSYDPENDPRYAAYKKEYAREGQRATADTMGQLAAMTGGMPSTAAVTAAQQAGDYYAAQMADKIPELYQLAYQMYMNEGDEMRANLGLLRGLEGDDWGRYMDQWNMADADRKYTYGVQSDNWNRGHTLDREAVDDERYADETAYDRQRQEQKDAIDLALAAASYGDMSKLQELGITPDTAMMLKLALASSGRTTPVGSGGGGGGGPKAQTPDTSDVGNLSASDPNFWSRMVVYANQYGEDWVKGYLKENWQALGFANKTAATDAWQRYAPEYGYEKMKDEERADYLADLYQGSIYETGEALAKDRTGSGTPNVSNQHTADMIVISGVTYPRSQLADMVANGDVIETYDQSTNTYTYTLAKPKGKGGLSQR